jgi:hypothetical protein
MSFSQQLSYSGLGDEALGVIVNTLSTPATIAISESQFGGGIAVLVNGAIHTNVGDFPLSLTLNPNSAILISVTTPTPPALAAYFTGIASSSSAGLVWYAASSIASSNAYSVTLTSGTTVPTSPNQLIYGFSVPAAYNGSPFTLTPPASTSGLPVTFSIGSGPATIASNSAGSYTITPTATGTIVLNADQAGNSTYAAAPTLTTSIPVLQQTVINLAANISKVYDGTAVSITLPNPTSPDSNWTTQVGYSTSPISAVYTKISGGGYWTLTSASNITTSVPVNAGNYYMVWTAAHADIIATSGGLFSTGIFAPQTDTPVVPLSASATIAIYQASATISLSNLLQPVTGNPVNASVTTNPSGLAYSITYNGSTAVPSTAASYAVVATITNPNYTPATISGTLVLTNSFYYNNAVGDKNPSTLGNWWLDSAHSVPAPSLPGTSSTVYFDAELTLAGTLQYGSAYFGLFTSYANRFSIDITATAFDLKSNAYLFNGCYFNSPASWTETIQGALIVNYPCLNPQPAWLSVSGGISYVGYPQTQTIAAFGAIPNQLPSTSLTVVPPLSSSGLPVTLSVVSGPATISGNTLTLGSTYGTVVLAANQAGNSSFLAATQVTTSFQVGDVAQTITFPAPAGPGGTTNPFTITAPTSSSGLPVTVTVKSGPATISGTTVTPTGAGTIVLAANQAGNFLYAAAAEVDVSVTAGIQTQTISAFGSIGNQVAGVPFTITLPTASSGLPVILTALSGTATISGNKITPTSVGTLTLAANQPGGSNFLAAPQQTVSITVAQGSQVIAPIPATSLSYSATPYLLTPPAATSGLPVTLSIVSGPGTLNGNYLTMTGLGQIVIAADQAGNSAFTAAPEVTGTITVIQANSTLTPSASLTVDFVTRAVTGSPLLVKEGDDLMIRLFFSGLVGGVQTPVIKGLQFSSLGMTLRQFDADTIIASTSTFTQPSGEDFQLIYVSMDSSAISALLDANETSSGTTVKLLGEIKWTMPNPYSIGPATVSATSATFEVDVVRPISALVTPLFG